LIRFPKPRSLLLVLAAVAVVGCGIPGGSTGIASPTPTPGTSGLPSAATPASTETTTDPWGPLAVVPPTGGVDLSRSEGTLRITDACVLLESGAERTLLMWPADRTRWSADTRTIGYLNLDGGAIMIEDGEFTTVGGSGESLEESGLTAEAFVARTPWVKPPAMSCPYSSYWMVGAIEP